MFSFIDISFVLLYMGIGLIVYSFYKWASQNKDFFEKSGIPALKPHLIFGNTAEFFFRKTELIDYIQSLYNNPAFKNEK